LDLPQAVPVYLVILKPDAAPFPDVVVNEDLPNVYPPYLVLGDIPDVAPDVSSADAESEAGARSDAGAETGPGQPDVRRDGTSPRDVDLDIPPPPPPYLMLPVLVPSAPGGTAPLALPPKKID
jgi:hypothetical protein